MLPLFPNSPTSWSYLGHDAPPLWFPCTAGLLVQSETSLANGGSLSLEKGQEADAELNATCLRMLNSAKSNQLSPDPE